MACTLGVAGVTTTDDTGTSATVIAAVPDFPSLVAVTVAVPFPVAVTRPVGDTVATAPFDDCQVTVRPVNVAPAASFVVAVNCWVWVTSKLATAGASDTVATGTGRTVTATVTDLPSLVAVIEAAPAASAPSSPVSACCRTR